MGVFALGAKADIFTLKDGNAVEGAILREDDTAYVIEVQVTKSIKDERVVAKADVVKVEGEKKDLTAFESISAFIPVPDVLSANDYAARIQSVEKFIKQHPDSSKLKQAQAILSVLKNEANVVLAGGLKHRGKIIQASEYQANMLDVDAGIREDEIRALLKDGKHLMALRAFAAFDRDFFNTTARAALLPDIIKTIKAYLAQTAQSLAGYDALMKEREVGLQRMQIELRRQTQAALDEEAAAFDKRLKAEKDAKIGWVTTHPSYKPSLDETMSFGKQELTRLTANRTLPAVDAGTAFREALRKIRSRSEDSSKNSVISEAKSAMVSDKYLAILQAAASS